MNQSSPSLHTRPASAHSLLSLDHLQQAHGLCAGRRSRSARVPRRRPQLAEDKRPAAGQGYIPHAVWLSFTMAHLCRGLCRLQDAYRLHGARLRARLVSRDMMAGLGNIACLATQGQAGAVRQPLPADVKCLSLRKPLHQTTTSPARHVGGPRQGAEATPHTHDRTE